MKKYIIVLMMAALAAGFQSCNYLDIVPDDMATDKDAFRDRDSAEDYLYGCYGFLPKMYQYMEYNNTTELSWSKLGWGGKWNIVTGVQSAADPGPYTYWARFYGGIRRCYLLIDNIDTVPRLEDDVKAQYKAEAKFLIAYFHFYLLKAYGPIPIITKAYPSDTSSGYPVRSDMDTCVQWISDLYDEAWAGLPVAQPSNYYGRATKAAAKSLKAKLWLYAASPLFNGNTEFYSQTLKDPQTGNHLIPQTVDPSKWTKTLQYALEAETECTLAGIELYQTTADPAGQISEPSDPFQYKLRMMIPDLGTKEIIWADGRREGTYDMQNNGTPRDWSSQWTWNMNIPTLEVVKRFYTSRGLPIDQDPQFASPSEYWQLGDYQGEQTARLHIDREPRFYSWISFHNGWYEMIWQGDAWGAGDTEYRRIRTKYRLSDPQGASTTAGGTELRTTDFSNTGYLNKKFMHPSNIGTSAAINTFPYSIMRLGDLYLIIAEAAVETNDLPTAKEYLNKIRTRAGIPTVETSWQGVATLDQSKLREIVRRERMIEMYLECDIMWDNKRWKSMHDLIPAGNGNPHGLDYSANTDAAFFRELEVPLAWRFISPTHYLLPIPDDDVNIVPGMAQNPGY